MLAQASNQEGSLRQEAMRTVLGEIMQRRSFAQQTEEAQKERDARTEEARLERKYELADQATLQKNQTELINLRESLLRSRPVRSPVVSPMAQAKHDKDMMILDKELAFLDLKLKGVGIPTTAEKGYELRKSEIERKIRGEEQEQRFYILDPGTNKKSAQAAANIQNENPTGEHIYYYTTKGTNRMDSWKFPKDKIHKGTGEPLNAANMIKWSDELGIPIDKFVAQMKMMFKD